MSYKINNTTMPDYTSISPEVHDLYGEGTGRDEAGINHLELIRAGTRKWKIKHEMLTNDEIETLVNALDPLGFSMTGYHPLGNSASSCYGTITISFRSIDGDGYRWDADVSIIEN